MAALELKGGERLQARLAQIAKGLESGGTLRVGFLEGATYPDGTSVATVAALLNFGISNGKRWPFFTQMLARKSPEWGVILARLLKQNDYDVEKALNLMGAGIKGQLQESIVEMNEPALEQSTIDAKGFEKPLIDTSNMINSVDWEVTAS